MQAEPLRAGVSRAYWFIAAAVAVIAAVPALGAGFVYDDHRFYEANEQLGEVSVLWRAFVDPAVQTANDTHAGLWRPLRTLMFALERSVFGFGEWGAWGTHAVSVALHGVGAALVARLLVAWRMTPLAALAGALLYALHPAQVECVAWMSSQGDLLAAALLWSALLALHAERRVLTLVLGVLALLSKEQAVVWPALALLSGLLGGRSLRDALRAAAPALGVVIVYLVLRSLVLDDALQQGGLGHGPAGARRLAAMVAHQAWFSLVPAGALFDWQMPISVDGSLPLVAAAIALLAAAAVAWPRTRVPALWWCAALAPTLFAQVLIPLNILVADRFLLFALPAVAFALAAACGRLRGGGAAAVVILISLGLLQAGGWSTWRSERTLWQRTADRVTGHARANHWLGLEALRENDLDAAVVHLRLAARNDGGANAYYNLGVALEHLGFRRERGSDEALALFQKARGAYLGASNRFADPRAQEAPAYRALSDVKFIDLTLLVGEVEEAVRMFEVLIARPRPEIPELRRHEWEEATRSLRVRLAAHVDADLAESVYTWARLP